MFPIIMLTAKIEDKDKIMGLTIGADDYITKPFNPLELVARVKSAIRRYVKYNEKSEEDKIYIDGLELCKEKHVCMLYDEKVELTPLEFDILLYLANNRGNVVSSEELFEKVWKEKYLDNNNTVMVHRRLCMVRCIRRIVQMYSFSNMDSFLLKRMNALVIL